jgi:anti-sigma regulatory factor (Ser/Thr protein kinase)
MMSTLTKTDFHAFDSEVVDLEQGQTREEGLSTPAEDADTVVLVVSELVTSAPRHGGGACTLDLTAHPDSIEVTVHDHSLRAAGGKTVSALLTP